MTTAPPIQTAPTTEPLTDTRHLHLVRDIPRDGAAGPGGPVPLVAYLVLVPEGTDPAALFAEGAPRPEIHRVAAADTTLVPEASGSARRPAEAAAAAPESAGQAGDDAVRIDPVRHVAELEGRELDLTYLEFALLAQLLRHPHHVLTRELLVTTVWGYDHVGDGRTVDVHIARLRRKLGKAHRHRIVTVRRVGYKYVPDGPADQSGAGQSARTAAGAARPVSHRGAERSSDRRESPDSAPCHRP
ncbi:winged helix-turn-helix domain-containing protein [Streptomyces sp. BYX5S]